MKIEIDVTALAQAIAQELRRITNGEATVPDADGGSEGEAPAPARRVRRPRREASQDDTNEQLPEQPKRRRARKSATSDVEQPTVTPGKPRRTRRRRSTAGADERGNDGAMDKEQPKTRRRSRRSNSSEAGTTTPRKSRRSNTASEPTAEDLAKAASEGARHLTPAGVMAILAELKVDGIGGLGGSAKQDFIDRVNEEIGAAS